MCLQDIVILVKDKTDIVFDFEESFGLFVR